MGGCGQCGELLSVSISDWPFKAAEAAVHLSNWLRTLQLPQLTGGLLTNVKQISVWLGLGPICLGVVWEAINHHRMGLLAPARSHIKALLVLLSKSAVFKRVVMQKPFRKLTSSVPS